MTWPFDFTSSLLNRGYDGRLNVEAEMTPKTKNRYSTACESWNDSASPLVTSSAGGAESIYFPPCTYFPLE
jgi:hypothetical protein